MSGQVPRARWHRARGLVFPKAVIVRRADRVVDRLEAFLLKVRVSAVALDDFDPLPPGRDTALVGFATNGAGVRTAHAAKGTTHGRERLPEMGFWLGWPGLAW